MEYVQQFPLKEFQAGELLLQKGDDATCLMAIREGFVKITAISDTGVERLLWIAGRYDDFLDRINTIDTATVEERLIRTLCYLAERFSGADTVDLYKEGLKLTHQDLASMIGSTRETVSLILSQLRREGVIEYGRKKFVMQPGQLMKKIERFEGL